MEEHARAVGSAILFSLDEFAADETTDIAQRLDQNNFLITPSLGKAATNNNLNNYGSHLPYDILHICSHGGETEGYYVEQEFTDRDGKRHVAGYFQVVSVAPEAALDPDKIKVESKFIFATLNGIPWRQRPISQHPKYVWDDMMHALMDDDGNVRRTPNTVPIALSCHI